MEFMQEKYRFEIPKNIPGEDTKIEFAEGKEFAIKILRNDLSGLERRIKELEAEGYKVFKRGPMFVVMDRTMPAENKTEQTYH